MRSRECKQTGPAEAAPAGARSGPKPRRWHPWRDTTSGICSRRTAVSCATAAHLTFPRRQTCSLAKSHTGGDEHPTNPRSAGKSTTACEPVNRKKSRKFNFAESAGTGGSAGQRGGCCPRSPKCTDQASCEIDWLLAYGQAARLIADAEKQCSTDHRPPATTRPPSVDLPGDLAMSDDRTALVPASQVTIRATNETPVLANSHPSGHVARWSRSCWSTDF